MTKGKYQRVYLHRVVAEQKLGRPLKKGEIVHHLDGDPTNNHPDNLEVCSSASVHRRHHRRSNLDKLTVDLPLIQDGDLWL
jgi:hypothetical protein